MIVSWVPLGIALLFGLLSPLWLLNCQCQFFSFRELWAKLTYKAVKGERRRRWWKLPLIWIDPMRGYVVAEFLADSFSAQPNASFIRRLMPLATFFGVQLLVIYVQTCGRARERESLSPAGFIGGMMFSLLHPVAALGAIIVGVATSVALRRYSYGYWAAAVTGGLLTYVFNGFSYSLVTAVVLVVSPVFISWFRHTQLVTPVRC